MNTDAISPMTDNQITDSASKVQSSFADDKIATDPQRAVKFQEEFQAYIQKINFKSSVLKAFKDMMMSIISKIG